MPFLWAVFINTLSYGCPVKYNGVLAFCSHVSKFGVNFTPNSQETQDLLRESYSKSFSIIVTDDVTKKKVTSLSDHVTHDSTTVHGLIGVTEWVFHVRTEDTGDTGWDVDIPITSRESASILDIGDLLGLLRINGLLVGAKHTDLIKEDGFVELACAEGL